MRIFTMKSNLFGTYIIQSNIYMADQKSSLQKRILTIFLNQAHQVAVENDKGIQHQ